MFSFNPDLFEIMSRNSAILIGFLNSRLPKFKVEKYKGDWIKLDRKEIITVLKFGYCMQNVLFDELLGNFFIKYCLAVDADGYARRMLRINNKTIQKKIQLAKSDLPDGLVYFISDGGGKVKVGFTQASPEQRLKSLQTGNGSKLIIDLVIPGTKEDEQEIHRILEEHRLEGEWFDYTAMKVEGFIKKLLTWKQYDCFWSLGYRGIDRPMGSLTSFCELWLEDISIETRMETAYARNRARHDDLFSTKPTRFLADEIKKLEKELNAKNDTPTKII